ncbi:MAG: glycoside hydrolase family 43 protein [Armatimonadetes bacterium]|nr:glycoside hydrolase family 43 protein [Armatimonadota bacterium]
MARFSGNPIFPGWYADPEIHWFDEQFVVYPTFSARYEDQTFFDCFTSPDLTNWQRHGRILDFKDIPWSTNRAAWAPSVAERDGRYFMYFSAGDGAGIGVAVAESPTGPFQDALGRPLVSEYINGAQPIDAHAFVDDDGQAYLFYGGWKHCNVVQLAPDMTSTEGKFLEITPEHYVEGPFMLKRNGLYYFMWSEGGWTDSSYGVAYAVADSPLGPFERIGSILSSDPAVGNGTGHHSVLRLPGSEEHVICYHRRPPGTTERDHRVTCLDQLVFEPDGTIRPVSPTVTGVPAWTG